MQLQGRSAWLCCTEQGAGASAASPCQTCVHCGWEPTCCLSLEGCSPALVGPSEGEYTRFDYSKSNILWYWWNSGLAHLFPLWLICLGESVFMLSKSRDNKLIFDAGFGLGALQKDHFFSGGISADSFRSS